MRVVAVSTHLVKSEPRQILVALVHLIILLSLTNLCEEVLKNVVLIARLKVECRRVVSRLQIIVLLTTKGSDSINLIALVSVLGQVMIAAATSNETLRRSC